MYLRKDEQRIFHSLLHEYKYDLVSDLNKEQKLSILNELEKLEIRLDNNWKDHRRVSKSGRAHSGDDFNSMLKRYKSK